ncbi:MAG TPA: peptidase MA family metallohydrolase [Candidatus Omnitrophota bacterium]|nr:peptidase MA family metallohydrolase [Candidatus Omnitrophota bacterium]
MRQSLFADELSLNEQRQDPVERRQKIELEKFYYGNGKDNKAPKTPIAIGFYNDAVKFYEKGEYDLARQALNESLALVPRNALAYELLGEIENLQQNPERASEYYKKSYLMNPTPRVRKRIEQLQKEQRVDNKLDTYDEEHFIIKYRRGEQGYEGYWLKNMLRECYRQVSQDFGYFLNHKTVVLFYSRDEFNDVTGQEHWVGGLYDGKIRLPSYQQGFKEIDLRLAAIHELTHAFVAILSGMRAPAWIHEGLAQYEEAQIAPKDMLVFEAAVKTKALIPLNRLFSEKMDSKKKDKLEIMLFYQESYMLVHYLVKRYQMYRIKGMLIKFKEGKTVEEAVEETFGISVHQLEKEWLATLSRT